MFTVFLILILAVAGILLYAYTRPDSYRVERKITIAAPAAAILPYLRNLQETIHWSQWEKIDPNSKRNYTGVMGEVGSTYHWDSPHKQAGEGRIEITNITDSRVEMDIQFIRPLPGRAKVDYSLEPMGKATVVMSAFQTSPPFLNKVICIFFNPEKIIGTMHEKSLNNLRTLVEANTAMGERMGRSVAKMTATPNSKTKVEKA
ncbi:MAG: SRPBCC family protein, partial [Alphaproteobacteria bacterium]|nr:SRPBCC family protein [Alphaproteobacteria bacterium]